MTQTATVKSTDGRLAEIEVSRKAMCDGCHKSSCGSGCPMSGLFSSGKAMTATAINKVGANAGDRVEVESSDRDVLITALLVFLLPLLTGGLFCAVATYFDMTATVTAAIAVVGFLVPFPILKIVETKAKKNGPKIVIKRIISTNSCSDEQ